MKSTATWIALALLSGFGLLRADGVCGAEDWISLFDGKSLSGWKAGENADSFSVRDGTIICAGPRAHLFYAGDVAGADFRNFRLKASVKTAPGANSGIYFHTRYQENGFPRKGFEAQINNTYAGFGNYREFKKTGSLYGIRNQFKSIAKDGEWFTMQIAVTGRRIRIWVDEILVVDFTEPGKPAAGRPAGGRSLSHGTFALQCHDPHGQVCFKDILVKPLPDEPPLPSQPQPVVDASYRRIRELHRNNFPLVDFHVHLKGGLTLEEALANSRKTGINYGIAPNCGLGFPITDDEGIYEFLETMQGQPVFVGMQAEGREWLRMFSKGAIARFDYVFTDAMTFTDDRGKRVRLWIKEEVAIDDPQAFMEMYVDRIVSVLGEPIDIYVNPTFLPAVIAKEYDALWTEARMQKVIDAAVENGVAIEINSRYRIPSPAFIKRAKKSGVKFSFGTNNGDKNLGRLEYCLEMIAQCGLTSRDMFMPERRVKKE